MRPFNINEEISTEDFNHFQKMFAFWKFNNEEAEEPRLCGKWMDVQDGYGICSNCNRGDHIDPLAKFCRYCGARTEG